MVCTRQLTMLDLCAATATILAMSMATFLEFTTRIQELAMILPAELMFLHRTAIGAAFRSLCSRFDTVHA